MLVQSRLSPVSFQTRQAKMTPTSVSFGAQEPFYEVDDIWNHAENAGIWNNAVEAGHDIHRPLFKPAFDYMRKNYPVRHQDVIDLGCGEGILCRQLADEGARKVVGVDISRPLLKAAREKTEHENIVYRESSFTDLKKIPDNAFDQAFSVMAMGMDSPGLEESYQEAYRVLKPGGQLFFVIRHPFTNRPKKNIHGTQVIQKAPYFSTDAFDKIVKLESPKGSYPFKSRHFPVTMQQLLNPLTKAGFIFKEMDEPRPNDALVRKVPRMKPWQHEPFCILVHAEKPKLNSFA